MPPTRCPTTAAFLALVIGRSHALTLPPIQHATRRSAFKHLGSVAATTALLRPTIAHGDDSLAARMAKRDAKVLKKQVFGIPPGEQVYPEWLQGEWDTTVSFQGYEFPSIEGFSKSDLVADVTVAGFQKLSIAQLVDVGRPSVSYATRWVASGSGGSVEDRAFNLRQAIDAGLEGSAAPARTVGRVDFGPGAPSSSLPPGEAGVAVNRVEYDGRRNPNRCSVVMLEGATRNAERIELFTNARESEVVGARGFVCSENLRQVTFSLSQDVGVARQVGLEGRGMSAVPGRRRGMADGPNPITTLPSC